DRRRHTTASLSASTAFGAVGLGTIHFGLFFAAHRHTQRKRFMFRSRNRHVFKPTAYGTRRQRRIPRWLVLLFSGIILGAGGLLFLQKSYGPTRLTAEQSEQLQHDLNSANI